MIYFDTSAFVKMVLAEPGHEAVRALWNESPTVVAAALLYPEARAAVAGAVRAGRVRPSRRTRTVASVDGLASEMALLVPSRGDLWRAGELAEVHALRGYDAVHLAMALTVVGQGSFVTADRQLGDAARDVGMRVVEAA